MQLTDELADLYETLLIKESKKGSGEQPLPVEKQKKPLESETPSSLADEDNTGPNGKLASKPIEKDKKSKDNAYDVDKFSESVQKKDKKAINNFMKSKFDELFENVMSGDDDLADLGVSDDAGAVGEPGDGGDLGDGSGEAETVTVTLDKATAQTLCDLLQASLGSGDLEEVGGESDDFGGDDAGFGGDASGDVDLSKESTDIEELKNDGKKFQEPGSIKVGVKSDPGKGKTGDGKVTDKVGNDGTKSDKSKLTSKGEIKVKGTATTLAGSDKSAFEG